MQIIYRKFNLTDLINSARLVRDVSRRYFHKDIKSIKGKRFWRNLQSLKKSNMPNQEKLFKSLPIKILAECNSKTVGIVTGKPNEVIMLFVRPSFHNKGIASELYSRFKKAAILNKSKLIKVKSSRFAEPFYQKVGFVRTGKEILIQGLPAIPMETKTE